MPRMPFSLCRNTSVPGGRWLATSVGMPMPRLTYAPSWMSCATRRASWSLVLRWYAMSGRLPEAAALRRRAGDLHDARDEDARRDDHFGVEGAERHDLVHAGDG